ncbi:hypothetical protein [Corynebacterium xerosis]|uniref:hypothetical protein n=1 Tax=Corynebacterium xerosis TaxID=1725 RepID=UPI001F08C21B|nr:hypothetical protein [Corynebacterium xerosis]
MPTSPTTDETRDDAPDATTVIAPESRATAADGGSATVMVGGRAVRVLVALGAALATFLIIGIPTDIIPNPIFGRDVPVRPWELPVLAATSVLTGMYFGLQRPGSEKSAPAIGGAGLAMFAVACPVCNKVILLALGTSGALGFWQPLQPFLAAISLLLLLAAVIWAWRRNPCADDGCDSGCSPR